MKYMKEKYKETPRRFRFYLTDAMSFDTDLSEECLNIVKEAMAKNINSLNSIDAKTGRLIILPLHKVLLIQEIDKMEVSDII